MFLKGLAKMIEVGAANVLNCKVVNNEGNSMKGRHLHHQSPGVVTAS